MTARTDAERKERMMAIELITQALVYSTRGELLDILPFPDDNAVAHLRSLGFVVNIVDYAV